MIAPNLHMRKLTSISQIKKKLVKDVTREAIFDLGSTIQYKPHVGQRHPSETSPNRKAGHTLQSGQS